MKEMKKALGNFSVVCADVGISAAYRFHDPALIEICATEAQGLPIHLSTQKLQQPNFGETLEFWKRKGWNVVVLAREVSPEEVWQRSVKYMDVEIRSIYSAEPCVSSYTGAALSNHIRQCGMRIVADALNLVVGNMDCSICLWSVKNEIV